MRCLRITADGGGSNDSRVRTWLAARSIWRNGSDGLAAKAQQMIGADPFSGHLFLFRGKRGDYLKALYWDGSGLCLYAKRLEKRRVVSCGRRSSMAQ
jgi:transposase